MHPLAMLSLAGLVAFTGEAVAQPCPTYSQAEIAHAIKTSAVAPASVSSRSCMWSGAAAAESGGHACWHNANNFGVLQLSRANIERVGLTPAQYMAEPLQAQIDDWARTAAGNGQSRGYAKIDGSIEATLRIGHVMDGVLAACSQFGHTICDNDLAIIEGGRALPLPAGSGAIRCTDSGCNHGTANQDGNGQTIVSWGLAIETKIQNAQCAD